MRKTITDLNRMQNLTKHLLLLIVIFPIIIFLSSVFAEKAAAQQDCKDAGGECKFFCFNGNTIETEECSSKFPSRLCCIPNSPTSVPTQPPAPAPVPFDCSGTKGGSTYECFPGGCSSPYTYSGYNNSGTSCDTNGQVCCVNYNVPTPTIPACKKLGDSCSTAQCCGDLVCRDYECKPPRSPTSTPTYTCETSGGKCTSDAVACGSLGSYESGGAYDLSLCPSSLPQCCMLSTPKPTATPIPTSSVSKNLVWRQYLVCPECKSESASNDCKTPPDTQCQETQGATCNNGACVYLPKPNSVTTCRLASGDTGSCQGGKCTIGAPTSCNDSIVDGYKLHCAGSCIAGQRDFSSSKYNNCGSGFCCGTAGPTATPIPATSNTICPVNANGNVIVKCQTTNPNLGVVCNPLYQLKGLNPCQPDEICWQCNLPTPTPTTVPTGTPAPTSPPPPTSTPPPGSVLLALSLTLEGIGANRTNLPIEISNVTVEVHSNVIAKQGRIIYSGAGKPDNGRFKGTVDLGNSLEAGEHIITIKIDKYLKKQVLVNIPSSLQTQTIQVSTNLLAGDVNNDGVVNTLDYSAVIDCFGPKKNAPTCTNKSSDIDFNGAVDGIDYNIVVRNFGKSDE